ncbi:glycosyltransferase family 2 protein [Echinicola sp. 20G]|uniref:glycosyltransferase family 2 protein n=1 Tax=Echinicola sp. 20G TaxID=2781961 RepID=UPI00190FDC12|nr:glycosyltransferase [Echinicola sp. 20G]
MTKLLTIVIPTYNRVEHLIKNIPFLLDQLNDECKLLILDNASDDYDVADKLKPILEKHNSVDINVLRNDYNVGLFGNIVKCFEKCETEWLFIMGDDDRIANDGINIILSDIKNNPDCVNISYKWEPEKEWSGKRPLFGKGINAYLNSIEGIHHVMFLSGNIYNTRKLNSYIHTGYNYCFSSAPHLAILIKYLEENLNCQFLLSEKMIVDNFNSEVEEKKKWDKTSFFKSIQFLIDVPDKEINRKEIFKIHKERYPILKYLKYYVNAGIKSKNDASYRHNFKISCFFYNVYGSNWDKFFLKVCLITITPIVFILKIFK